MKVSIITVSYNSANTIRTSIESILNQTYQDIEYWIIDGGSKDDTVKIIQEYEPKFNGRLKWISERDNGIYDAMNKGVMRCTGDIIGLLNSDDFFTTNDVIETMVKNFTSDIDAMYGDVHFVDPSDITKCVRYYSGSMFKPWMVRFGYMPPHPALYVRKTVYDKYGLYKPDYKISADFEFIARILYVLKLPYKYQHLDFVTMREGGASTVSLRSRIRGAEEDLIACRQLGISTCRFFIYIKFFMKKYQAMFIKK